MTEDANDRRSAATDCYPRLLPAPYDGTRVETGAVQFGDEGDDWPGVFIRGDQASYWAMTLQQLVGAIESGNDEFALMLLKQPLMCPVGQIADLLGSCRI
mgnify:CR=1 FL=1